MSLDSLLTGDPEAIEALPYEKRIGIPGGLPLELSIEQISQLAYPDDKDKQEALSKALVNACKAGDLLHYGDINGWSYRKLEPNPYPKVKGSRAIPLIPGFAIVMHGDEKKFNDEIFVNPMFCCDPSDCLIHRNDFEAYLKHNEKWPVSGLLANWFDNCGSKTKGSLHEDSKKLSKTNCNKMLHVVLLMAIDAYDHNPESLRGYKGGIGERLNKHGIDIDDEDICRYLMKPEEIAENFTKAERSTILKLMIGMAIDGYGYNQKITKRNPFTGEGDNSLVSIFANSRKIQTFKIQINIKNDALYGYLTEAKKLINQETQ